MPTETDHNVTRLSDQEHTDMAAAILTLLSGLHSGADQITILGYAVALFMAQQDEDKGERFLFFMGQTKQLYEILMREKREEGQPS